MSYQDISYAVADFIATITLNRPQTLNALTHQMVDEMVDALERARVDQEVRAVIITGAGRGFCSGANVKGFAAAGEQVTSLADRRYALKYYVHKLPLKLRDFEKPVIAMVNGPAAGAGMDIANMCDIRVASDRARFGMTYVRMGLVPGDGGAYFLPRIVGLAKACELIWSGEIIDAQEALRIGLVSYVFPHDELEKKTREFVTKFTKMAPIAVQLAKHCIYRGMELDLPHTLEYLESAQLIARSTEDAKEGPRAWIEKREPVFQGR